MIFHRLVYIHPRMGVYFPSTIPTEKSAAFHYGYIVKMYSFLLLSWNHLQLEVVDAKITRWIKLQHFWFISVNIRIQGIKCSPSFCCNGVFVYIKELNKRYFEGTSKAYYNATSIWCGWQSNLRVLVQDLILTVWLLCQPVLIPARQIPTFWHVDLVSYLDAQGTFTCHLVTPEASVTKACTSSHGV